jgi:hypothetical protein
VPLDQITVSNALPLARFFWQLHSPRSRGLVKGRNAGRGGISLGRSLPPVLHRLAREPW